MPSTINEKNYTGLGLGSVCILKLYVITEEEDRFWRIELTQVSLGLEKTNHFHYVSET